MNERIRKLAEQAGLLYPQLGPSVETRYMKKKEQKLERFAQLIVWDCVEIIEMHRIPIRPSPSDELRECRDKIKKHFGVEPYILELRNERTN